MTNPPAEHPPADHQPADELGYAAALAELDTILRELEGTDVDVDRLADRVRRAASLIQVCRERIGGARMQIDAVIADLDAVTHAREQSDAADPEPA